jgi:hypothetical protein
MSQKLNRLYRLFLIIIFTIAFIIWVIAQINPEVIPLYLKINTYFIIICGIVTLLFTLHILGRYHKSSFHTLLFSFGLISWGIGEIAWDYYINVLMIELPYPSYADIPYSLMYPMTVVGILSVIMQIRGKGYKTLKYMGIISIFLSLVFYFLIIRYGVTIFSSVDSLKSFFDATYIGWDLLLLISTIILGGFAILSPKRNTSVPTGAILVLSLSMLFMLIADTFFAYLTNLDLYSDGNFIDICYLFSAFLLAHSTIKFNDRELGDGI